MTRPFEPFAVELYKRYLNGETIDELSAELGIPADRITMRIQAAAEYVRRRQESAADTGFHSSLVALGAELEEKFSPAA